MRHVFAKADVAHQNQPGHFALKSTPSLLHNPVLGPSPGSNFVLLLRQSKQHDRRHSQRMSLLRFLHRLIHRQVAHARHRANFFPHPFARTHKHRINERVRSKPRLTHQVAQFSRAAQAAKSSNRKCHGRSPWEGLPPFEDSRPFETVDACWACVTNVLLDSPEVAVSS